ncbi:MAG TPA: flavin reductase family protein [Bryobacteraceae bacterium]|jgi:flavin reductase (DIM6/NTAB) family NADH-FMN oxidoreductase RutF|nr:flavin reductase family protein [Bryobacteraceae bacterium]
MPTAPAVSPTTFRNACAHFASGVAIACVRDPEGNPHGLTISSFTGVSLAPPLILICVDGGGKLVPYFRVSEFFAVNILNHTQRHLSVAFAVKPERRFEGVPWHAGKTGVPLLDNVLSTLECRTTNVMEAGDHVVIFGEVVAASLFPGEPLVYYNRNYRSLGS